MGVPERIEFCRQRDRKSASHEDVCTAGLMITVSADRRIADRSPKVMRGQAVRVAIFLAATPWHLYSSG